MPSTGPCSCPAAAAAKSLQLCSTVRPRRQQPTRLPHPWDSPGKNTGVGCHFLLQCMKVKSESEVAQSCLTLCDPVDSSLPGSSVQGISRQEYWSGVPLPSPLVLVIMVELILSLDTTGKSFLSPGQKFLCAYMSPASNLVKMKILI